MTGAQATEGQDAAQSDESTQSDRIRQRLIGAMLRQRRKGKRVRAKAWLESLQAGVQLRWRGRG
jgi:hypothetical protein